MPLTSPWALSSYRRDDHRLVASDKKEADVLTSTTNGARMIWHRAWRGLLVAVAVTLSFSAALAGNAFGGALGSGRVSGTYSPVDFGNTECVALDDVRLHCATSGFKSRYEGDLVGESTATFEQVINCATGRTYGLGVETFGGSLRGGRSGVLTWRFVLEADFDCEAFFPSNLRILGVVTKGSGGLASVRGALLFDDTSYRGLLG